MALIIGTLEDEFQNPLIGTAEDDQIFGLAGDDALIGQDGNDFLNGGDDNDNLSGGAGDDVLEGGAGNDLLSGNLGNDVLEGGVGNDVYSVEDIGDLVVEAANQGTDIVFVRGISDFFSYTLGANLENLELEALGDVFGQTGIGNELNNVLRGGLDSSLYGLEGNDTLIGLTGNDLLDGGTGSDSMTGGNGNDVYVINSTSEILTEAVNEGIDTVRSSFNFTLRNNSNLENLQLIGSARNGNGNSFDNQIVGNTLNNTLNGNDGDDHLSGLLGNDTLNGGAGIDTLIGGAGNDLLVSGVDDDTLIGGAGRDGFRFNSLNERRDTIVDFVAADDVILVSASGFGGGLTAGAAISAAQFRQASNAGDANDRFMFNNIGLFFDPDGTGAIPQVQIAVLLGIPTVTNADIFVIA